MVKVLDVDTAKNRKYARKYEDNPQVEIIWGDLRNPKDVLNAFDDRIHVVINLAAVIPRLAKTKLMYENLIQDSDVEWPIFRLTYIVSPEKLEIDPLMFCMPLETSLEICHTEDVGRALANTVENEEIWGRIFHMARGEKCRTTYSIPDRQPQEKKILKNLTGFPVPPWQ